MEFAVAQAAEKLGECYVQCFRKKSQQRIRSSRQVGPLQLMAGARAAAKRADSRQFSSQFNSTLRICYAGVSR